VVLNIRKKVLKDDEFLKCVFIEVDEVFEAIMLLRKYWEA